MRICLVNPTILMRRPISKLAHLLKKKKNTINIFTPKAKMQNLYHINYLKHPENKIITYDYYQLPIQFEWPLPKLDFYLKLSQIYKKNDIIHIWTYSYLSTLFLILYTKLRNIFNKKKRKIIISTDTIPGESFKFNSTIDILYKLFNNTLARLQLHLADRISLYSKSLIPHFKKISNNKNLSITPTGIFFNEKELNNNNNKQKIKFNKNKKYITFIGLIGERKGIDIIIKIAKHFQKNKKIEFLMVGDSSKKKYWQKRSPRNMNYIGRSNEISHILKNSDAFLFPSRAEGLAGVIMEAIKDKCLILTTPIIGTKDIVTNKEAYLIDHNSVKEYVKVINSIIQDKNKKLNSEKIKKAYKKLKKEFDWEINIKKWIKMYKEVY